MLEWVPNTSLYEIEDPSIFDWMISMLEYVCFKLLNYACVPHWLEMNSHVYL